MLTLANDALRVELLHPEHDQARFGVRYCTGGYVFQVHDARHGPLLTGPTYPDSFNWFDGQGIPDAFNLGPILSTERPHVALVIGTGECDLQARTVLTFAQWRIEQHAAHVEFTTEQQFEETSLRLERTVGLHGRTLRSHTRLTNLGSSFVPMRWFPHPFYPQPGDAEGDADLLWTNAPLTWHHDAHYALRENGYIARRGWPWREGHYLALEHTAQAPLVLLQRHPALGIVGARCSYVPDHFPVWGNAHTFSWEPFLERIVAPGRSLAWHIDYDF